MSIGVSFLSFPFVVPPFYRPPPPVSSPSGVSFTTFPATIRHRRLLTRRTQGGRPDAYATVDYSAVSYGYDGITYRAVTYRPVPYAYVDVTYALVIYRGVTFATVTYSGVTYCYVVVTYGYVGKGRH